MWVRSAVTDAMSWPTRGAPFAFAIGDETYAVQRRLASDSASRRLEDSRTATAFPSRRPKEWARAQRRAGARTDFRERAVRRGVNRLCRRPESRRGRPGLHELPVQARRGERHDAQVRLRAAQRRENQSEVRMDARNSIGGRGHPAAPRAGFRRRSRVTRRDGAVLRLPLSAIPLARARSKCSTSPAYFDKRIDYSAYRDFTARQRRAQSRRRGDRGRATSADGRFTSSTRSTRRAAARRAPKWMRSG